MLTQRCLAPARRSQVTVGPSAAATADLAAGPLPADGSVAVKLASGWNIATASRPDLLVAAVLGVNTASGAHVPIPPAASTTMDASATLDGIADEAAGSFSLEHQLACAYLQK